MELTNRVLNILKRNSITLIVHLITRTDLELLNLRNMGEMGVREIEMKLDEWGLSLGTTSPPPFQPEEVETTIEEFLSKLDINLLKTLVERLGSV